MSEGIEYPPDAADGITVPAIADVRAARDFKQVETLTTYLRNVGDYYNFIFDCLMVAKGNGIQKEQTE